MFRRLACASVLLALATIALGARCIEHSVVRTDDAGNTDRLGEIYNDTNVQGSEMTFHATLFDVDHNPLAANDVTMCPAISRPTARSSTA